MRIVQVVTLVTPEGAYGGPVRVAINQAHALIDAGHDVTVAAAHHGFVANVPTTIDGVPVQLFPAATRVHGIGFAGLASPGLRSWLAQQLPKLDVLHVHLARDFITLPAARAALKTGTPLVVQPHGMLDASRNPLALPLDAVYTKPILRGADTVFFLTDREEQDLTDFAGPDLALTRLHNGVRPATSGHRDEGLDVLFVARLHERKRPTVFVEMARFLTERFPGATFSLVGADEGEGPAVQQAIAAAGASGRIRWEGALSMEEALLRTQRSSIFVLPSVNEPFPMAVLEAMAAGLPVVVTDTCGLAPVIESTSSGIVVDSSLEQLTDAVAGLLEDAARRRKMGAAALSTAGASFGMASVEQILSDRYHLASGQSAIA